MADARVKAAAVRLQRALREYLKGSQFADILPGTIEPAQSLLQAFEASDVSDHSFARGRPLVCMSQSARSHSVARGPHIWPAKPKSWRGN